MARHTAALRFTGCLHRWALFCLERAATRRYCGPDLVPHPDPRASHLALYRGGSKTRGVVGYAIRFPLALPCRPSCKSGACGEVFGSARCIENDASVSSHLSIMAIIALGAGGKVRCFELQRGLGQGLRHSTLCKRCIVLHFVPNNASWQGEPAARSPLHPLRLWPVLRPPQLTFQLARDRPCLCRWHRGTTAPVSIPVSGVTLRLRSGHHRAADGSRPTVRRLDAATFPRLDHGQRAIAPPRPHSSEGSLPANPPIPPHGLCQRDNVIKTLSARPFHGDQPSADWMILAWHTSTKRTHFSLFPGYIKKACFFKIAGLINLDTSKSVTHLS